MSYDCLSNIYVPTYIEDLVEDTLLFTYNLRPFQLPTYLHRRQPT